jgi:hypothetical protein
MKFYNGSFDHLKRVFVLMGKLVEGYGGKVEVNPFENMIVAPLFYYRPVLEFYRCWRLGEIGLPLRLSSVIMDSGGYQVQTGKIIFGAWQVRLRRIWSENDWADFYVLPDHVPKTSDLDFEVERKVKDTLEVGERFLKFLPKGKVAIGVVHGRNLLQVLGCVRRWQRLGVRYVAFGSFGTSGPYGGANVISQRSLKLLKAVHDEARSFGMDLHVFGISYPSYVRLMVENGIYPTSVDSVGWWKAAQYRQIFFDGAPQRCIFTAKTDRKQILSIDDIEAEKARAGHSCPFCARAEMLADKFNLALHNLIVTVDTISKVCYDRRE